MDSEEKTRQDIRNLVQDNVNAVCDLLRHHESDILDYLAYYVASLCGITYEDIVSGEKTTYIVQCRWLFWHAYRYMTNETYIKMAERMGRYGHKYNQSTITFGVNRMARMIDQNTVWTKRWLIIKRLIKTYNETTVSTIPSLREPSQVHVVVYHPASVEVKVELREEK